MKIGETGAMNSKVHSVVLVHQRTAKKLQGRVHREAYGGQVILSRQ